MIRAPGMINKVDMCMQAMQAVYLAVYLAAHKQQGWCSAATGWSAWQAPYCSSCWIFLLRWSNHIWGALQC